MENRGVRTNPFYQYPNPLQQAPPSHTKKPSRPFPIKRQQQKRLRKSAKQDINSFTVKKLAPIPLKKISKCPKPTLLKATDDNYYIIFLTDYFSDKQCLSYNVKRQTYFQLCAYPELKFTSPTYTASPDGKHMYIYDGVHQSFAMLDIDIDSNDAAHHPTVSNIRKTIRKTEKLRNLVKTGKGLLSIYLPAPWNEFHIIGGKDNIQHLKWSGSKKQFVQVSETAPIVQYNVRPKGLLAHDIFFSSKLKEFVLLGGNDENDCIFTLSYRSNVDKSAGLFWLKSVCKLPYEKLTEFGSILLDGRYIILFGGNAMTPKSKRMFKMVKIDAIFIFDLERHEWRKSQICCPIPDTYYAIYVKQTRNIHLFNREKFDTINNEFKHWCMDMDAILKQTIEYKGSDDTVDEKDGIILKVYDNDIKIDVDEEIDCKKSDDDDDDGDVLTMQKLQKDVEGIRSEVSMIWDLVSQLKNDMQIIKDYQLEIITNTEQNSLKILDHHNKIVNEINKIKNDIDNNNNDNETKDNIDK